MSNSIRRVLVYTHNSIGLGHIFRILAIITGIKRSRPDIDFLVISGTSVPGVLLRHEIEVIKLPSVRKEMTGGGNSFTPRFLHGTDLKDILEYRKQAIANAFDFFKPDVLMVEHYLTGLAGEVMPLLDRKRACRGTPADFALAGISRGIMGGAPGSEGYPFASADYAPLYDFIYVFDDKATIDVNRECFGGDPLMEPRIRYVGRITDRGYDEIPDPPETRSRLRLSKEPIILMNLCRHGNIEALARHLVTAFHHTGLMSRFQVLMVLDPYLERTVLEGLQKDPLFEKVRFLPFFYALADLIRASELVICRGGYNIINELLLTDAKALVIPEHHPSGEQERRARLIPRNNITVMAEGDILASPPDHILSDLLGRETVPLHFRFDKYAIGNTIITELESWRGRGKA